ncbi:MAG TPA: hypothetical protein VN796_01970 [Acidimicrobiales bacterium]|nr:hypothetical protein [Acidimicrobiales bacterium]
MHAYRFDASGASRPLADTLSAAMTLAREELGIEFTQDDAGFPNDGTADPASSLEQMRMGASPPSGSDPGRPVDG